MVAYGKCKCGLSPTIIYRLYYTASHQLSRCRESYYHTIYTPTKRLICITFPKRQQNTCSNRACVQLACHRSVGHHCDEWFLTKYNCTMPYGNQSHPRAPGIAAAVTSYLSTNLLTLANEITHDELGRPPVL